MISTIQIQNFKSIADLTLGLGGMTVLIGENGCGKSNILEAIAFAAAASADKLDNEFLATRGVRVTEKEFMRCRFIPQQLNHGIEYPYIRLKVRGLLPANTFDVRLFSHTEDQLDLLGWMPIFGPDEDSAVGGEALDLVEQKRRSIEAWMDQMGVTSTKIVELSGKLATTLVAQTFAKMLASKSSEELKLKDFLIFAPENSVLRNFETEGAIRPLGTKGEGLLKLLSHTAASGNGHFADEINRLLSLLGWFQRIKLPSAEDEFRGRIELEDRWLGNSSLFDQRSANEGFLYLLFYFTLFLSKQTPGFFAIDNIDNALNPKLCSELMRQLTALGAKTGKQVICTTHNPAVLDGLNLQDDNQRLYVVRRDSEGRTVANRVKAPRHGPEAIPMKLSEAFMAGMLGGLPEHF